MPISGSQITWPLPPAPLIDFAMAEEGSDICHAYAILRESQSQRSMTICGGRHRESQVYMSASHQLEVRVLAGREPSRRRYFILKYEGNYCHINSYFHNEI